MFYKNLLNSKKTKEEDFTYDMLSSEQKVLEDDNTLKYKDAKIVYNFSSQDGALKTGFGFEELKMPTNRNSLGSETLIPISGTEVKSIWKLKWYDSSSAKIDKYYLFYFNNENKVCYDNILDTRIATNIISSTYTQTPYATYYRKNGEDYLMLTGAGNGLMLISGSGIQQDADAPEIISCCTHYGKLFAITAGNQGKLEYADDMNVLNWSSEQTQNLDFSDGRGNLNKIVSFDDYLYIFRDFGITKVSIYGKNEEFSISHMYFSDSFIYPNTIAQSGDNIYFLTDSGLKVFNGASVKNIELETDELLKRCDNKNASATCFNGKYYLACRGDFKDNLSVGCESYTNGYKNNLLFIYDLETHHIDLVRGVDIRQLLALTNPYKSKLVACFNNEHKGKIGQLSQDGKIFGTALASCIKFAKSDFGAPNKKKRIKSFLIQAKENCTVKIASEEKTQEFSISGSESIQRIKTNITGKIFSVEIKSSASEKSICKFVLTLGKEWKQFTEIEFCW